MIIDSLKNADGYKHIHPLFKKAFDYLRTTDFSRVETGRVQLEGEDLFVIISDSEMRDVEDAKVEVHNKYIDIQLPISKPETFSWISRKELHKPSSLFDESKDIQFFEEKGQLYFELTPGNFSVFFPEDGHAPCVGQGTIRKVVVKIRV